MPSLSVTCFSLLFRLIWCSGKCDLTVARGERGVLENLGKQNIFQVTEFFGLISCYKQHMQKKNVIREHIPECSSNCPLTALKTDNSF